MYKQCADNVKLANNLGTVEKRPTSRRVRTSLSMFRRVQTCLGVSWRVPRHCPDVPKHGPDVSRREVFLPNSCFHARPERRCSSPSHWMSSPQALSTQSPPWSGATLKKNQNHFTIGLSHSHSCSHRQEQRIDFICGLLRCFRVSVSKVYL